MATLNHTLPAAWQEYSTLEVMQILAIYVPFISDSHIKSLRANTTISMLAGLYNTTNGTASQSQIRELLGASVGNFERLSAAIGQTNDSSENAEYLQQTMLWGHLTIDNLPNYSPEVGYLALGIIFMVISITTTIIRLYQRSHAPAGLQTVDYALIMALAIAIAMEGLFGTCEQIFVLAM